MTRTFTLPDLGEGLTEAEIVTWLVAEGDVVAVDQAVAEVETAKSVVEVPTPYAGVVERLCAGEGETLEVGLPLLEVADETPQPGGDPSADAGRADGPRPTAPDGHVVEPEPTTAVADEQADPEAHAVAAEELTDVVGVAPSAGDETHREEERAGSGNVLVGYGTRGAPEEAGPRRRRRPRSPDQLAHGSRGAERGSVPSDVGAPGFGAPRPASGTVASGSVETGTVQTGTVETGSVETGTVGTAPETAGPGPSRADGEVRIPLTGFQKAAAAAMSRSRAEIPEATIWVDVDFTALTELRAARPDGPGILAYLARFVTAALAEYPVLNARVDAERDEIVRLGRVNLGLAVQGSRGLVAPAVLGAERMTAARLDAAIRDLVARTREGRATTEELTAGTFTLNNYGGLGVDGSAPIINHPQVAMLGVGRIIDRPWVVDGLVEPRKIAQVSFVFDHRVCDGVVAAAFLRAVTGAVEDPLSVIERL